MKKIGQFFDNFNSKAIKEIQKREIIAKIIKDEIKQDIPLKDIVFKYNTVNITGSFSLKNEILIKKNKLIKQINKSLSNLKIEDIK